jgi:glycosyltransferase involved in cell wall biosynthesis
MNPRALIIIENAPFALDARVRPEAQALRAAGWDVTVICPGDPGTEEGVVSLDARVIPYPSPPALSGVAGYVVEYCWSLAWIMARTAQVARSGVDVVQYCNPPDVLFVAGGLARLFTGCALVFDHHDLSPELFAVKFGDRAGLRATLRLLERLSFAAADVVLSTNESYKALAVSRGHMRPEKVFVVRNGPAEELLARATGSGLDSRTHGARHFTVGYVGMIGEQDGMDLLVRAAHQVVRTAHRDDIGFLVIGDGPALPAAKRLAEELGVASHIKFTGVIRGPAMYAALDKADICLAPDPRSPYSDRSTMIKIMEYMALGKPVVQFDLVEGRRSAGEAAVYARHNDPRELGQLIISLVDDPARRQRMGAIGKERIARDLAWQHQAPRLLEAYAAALEVTRVRRSRRDARTGIRALPSWWPGRSRVRS